jgi:hypothetical protein
LRSVVMVFSLFLWSLGLQCNLGHTKKEEVTLHTKHWNYVCFFCFWGCSRDAWCAIELFFLKTLFVVFLCCIVIVVFCFVLVFFIVCRAMENWHL